MEQAQLAAALPYSQSFLADWHPSTLPPFGSDDWADANFKHRVWLTWFLMDMRAAPWRRSLWSKVIEDAEDLWLWEDGDEEYIRALRSHLGGQFRLPEEDWCSACAALDVRITTPRTPAREALTHLSVLNRVRMVGWLIVAGPMRQHQLQDEDHRFQNLAMLIAVWGRVFHSHSSDSEVCTRCGVSHILPIWVETMLEVYSLDDLRSIPWPYGCQCLESQFAATSEQHIKLKIPLGTDSVALHVLCELVVSPWSLILWVAFRNIRREPDPLQGFLEILRDDSSAGRAEVFVWDDEDDLYLSKQLNWNSSTTRYPHSWQQHMVEIDLKDWQLIQNLTWTTSRSRRGFNVAYDLNIRLAALFLTYSSPSTFIAPDIILVPFKFSSDDSIFTSMARVINGNQRNDTTLVNFDSADFWNSSKLEGWLMECSKEFCLPVWPDTPSSERSVLERVDFMYLVLTRLPQNLVIYTHAIMRRSDQWSLWVESASWTPMDILEQLKSYCSVVQSLVDFLKQFYHEQFYQSEDYRASHNIAKDIYVRMGRDITVVFARLVLFLRDSGSYKRFLACRGTDAQQLLDLLQDLLDHDNLSGIRSFLFKALLRLSRTSGLHPRCLALPGLQKVGKQVAAGGFGDIWKGLVREQIVSVKIMRLFQDTDVEEVLKEFGREALIWRQICHPNLLPFCGLYYLDDRLCLVSPWMENGNILQFLSRELHNVNRLSLILDVALGIEYLHENDVVHGDLKAMNILVTPSRRACIADFGQSSIVDAMTVRFTHSTASSRGGTARYQAPELFRGGSKNHFGSDVYAFACVCYEIITGKVPFHEWPNDMAVMFQVADGKRPSQPSSCSGTTALDNLWKLVEDCWKDKPDSRPTAVQIVERLKSPLIQATTTRPTTDWDEKFSSKFRRSLQVQPLLPSINQIEHMIFGHEVAEVCEECFPEQESSEPANTKGLRYSERQPKRALEEEPLDLHTGSEGNPNKLQQCTKCNSVITSM
ncbi:hypothetical protein C8R44DRAFT_443990 [Mycena epipterygia]|nr:hypothetical protein C8R44DRAFT_443990 [Mycena epipterygia]